MSQKYQTEFVIRQYYTVHIDESRLEQRRPTGWIDPTAEHVEEHFARLRRIFQAILADKKALYPFYQFRQ